MKTFMSGTQTEEDESSRLNISLTSPVVWLVSWFPHRCMLHAASTKALNGSSNAVYLKKQNKQKTKHTHSAGIFTPKNENHWWGWAGKGRGKEGASGRRSKNPTWNESRGLDSGKHTQLKASSASTHSAAPPFPEQLTRRGSNGVFCQEKQKHKKIATNR